MKCKPFYHPSYDHMCVLLSNGCASIMFMCGYVTCVLVSNGYSSVMFMCGHVTCLLLIIMFLFEWQSVRVLSSTSIRVQWSPLSSSSVDIDQYRVLLNIGQDNEVSHWESTVLVSVTGSQLSLYQSLGDNCPCVNHWETTVLVSITGRQLSLCQRSVSIHVAFYGPQYA